MAAEIWLSIDKTFQASEVGIHTRSCLPSDGAYCVRAQVHAGVFIAVFVRTKDRLHPLISATCMVKKLGPAPKLVLADYILRNTTLLGVILGRRRGAVATLQPRIIIGQSRVQLL